MKTVKAFVVSSVFSLVTGGGSWLTGVDPHPPLPALRPLPGTASAPVTVRTPGRLLAYDPRGDGRAIEVFGSLRAARHIAVLVPGTGWDLNKLLKGSRNADPVRGAQVLRAQMAALDPSARTAVVVWLGYDAPEDIDRQAFRSERAAAGARALVSFVRALPDRARLTLVGHSYGTVVLGRAASRLPEVSDLVALASPGMDAGSVADLGTGARVWAARASGDPIRLSPDVRMAGYGHLTDPVSPEFGAAVFRTGGIRGHNGYYRPGSESVLNLARIILGRAGEVTRG
ncbi:alpha/beta hydrolase [Actinocorallia sp. B10E7]|uniref:alpha/beta hydrolase n=1 Tax=Actinocorallia sp. B10E7 TaxID=3153558 RepID=UPI00325C46CE